MAQETFKRKDLKYLCSNDGVESLLNELGDFLIEDINMGDKRHYTVKSLYFDSPEYAFLNSHNDIFKQKVRLRSYNDNGINDASFIEIKSKYKDVSIKRRMCLKLDSSYKFLLEGILPADNEIADANIFNEIKNLKKYNDLLPVVKIVYKRMAFYHRDAPDIRMTIDRDIICDFDDLRLESKTGSRMSGERIIDKNSSLIEIKSMYGIPFEMVESINGIRLFPQSFSKYIVSLEKMAADLAQAMVC